MPSHHDVYVNSAQLVVCAANVPELTRQDILQSSLCAQLVADKSVHTNASEWQQQYGKGILRFNWLRSSTSTIQLDLAGQSRSLLDLLVYCVNEPAIKPLARAVLRDLHNPVNASAMEVLHQAIRKPTGSADKPGLWLEIMLVQSEKSIRTVSLTLEDVRLPAGRNWLSEPLVSVAKAGRGYAQINTHQLLPSYMHNRALIIQKLGNLPDRLTLAILRPMDELDGMFTPHLTDALEQLGRHPSPTQALTDDRLPD